MNYHLHLNGKDLGVFTLEELRRRRASGELTGSEFVWCQGMAGWEPLETVLQLEASKASPPPIPASARKSNRVVPVVLTLGLVCLLIVIVVFGFAVKRVVQRAGPLIKSIAAESNKSYGNDSALTAASKPVVVGSNTLTATQVMERDRKFRVRQYVEGYKQRGEHNPATDDLALGYVENWIACNYNGTVNTNLPPLAELGDRLAADPACTDPLVLTVAGVNSVELHESINRLERAVKGFENSRHLGYPKFYATVMLEDKIFNDREDRLPVLDALALKRFREAMTDGSIQPGDQAGIAELFVSGWARNFFSRNADAVISTVKTSGEAFTWMALVLEGEHQITEAWQARGGGYVNTVSSEGWKGFNDHLAAARSALTQAWQLNPAEPLAPCRMIYVSLGDANIGEMRKWFDHTVAAQIDYPEAWSDMRWGLRPRWYGDQESMLAFGLTALNTRRFDTDVPRKFFDSLNDMESELSLPAGQHIYGREDIWPHLQEMYAGYIANTATPDWTLRGWRSAFSVTAYLAGKPEVARQQLELLNWSPDHWNLTGWNQDLSLMAQETAARTSPQAQAVEQAEARRQADDFSGALKIYRGIAVTNLEPPAQEFVRERLESLATEQRLHAGEWVDFLPATTNLTGWQVERGQCKVLPDGALEVQSDENGHMLYSRVRMGTDFEVRGQFELVRSSDRQFQGGLVMGVPQFETQNWYAFRMKRTTAEGDVASFSQHWSKRQDLAPAMIDAGTNTFWFRFHGGKISATVNGHDVFRDVDPPQNTYVSTNEFLLGLGAFNDSNKTVIRYRNVQAHLLSGQ